MGIDQGVQLLGYFMNRHIAMQVITSAGAEYVFNNVPATHIDRLRSRLEQPGISGPWFFEYENGSEVYVPYGELDSIRFMKANNAEALGEDLNYKQE